MTAELVGFHLEVKPSFWVLLALLLLTGENSRMLLLCFIACTAHELGHLMAACWLRLRVKKLTVSAIGLILDIPRDCSYLGEFFLAASGPIASFLFAGLASQLAGEGSALLAGISLMQGCFNLLPVQPLDGGEMLRVLLAQLLPPDKSWQAARLTGYAVCVLAIAFGSVLAVMGNPALLMMGLVLALGQRRRDGRQEKELPRRNKR
ncbi:MAG: site-2 protease family protein, partial [Oscillospiraceae bacterium]|nr:site-2 protease family protein [Oscillospiraceae bacterium]